MSKENESNHYHNGFMLVTIVAIVAIFGLVFMFKSATSVQYSTGQQAVLTTDKNVVTDDSNLAGDRRYIPLDDELSYRGSPTYWTVNMRMKNIPMMANNPNASYGCINLYEKGLLFGTASNNKKIELPPNPPNFDWYYVAGADSKDHYQTMLYTPSSLPNTINLEVGFGSYNCVPATVTWSTRTVPSNVNLQLVDAYTNGQLMNVDMKKSNGFNITNPNLKSYKIIIT